MNKKSIFKDGANKNLTHPKNTKGITLIALVITIIVLLILAGVSIATLTGQNGILTKARTSKTDAQRANAIEQAKIDILAWQTEQMKNKQSTELTDSKVKEILTGKDYLNEGTLDEEGFKNKDGDIVFKYSDLYKQTQTTPTVAFNPETFELGTAINSDKYGWKVTGYTKTTPEFTTGVWRLFYQDNNYTYLITDEVTNVEYIPKNYYTTVKKENGELKYQTGADVSIVGQKLSKKLLDEGRFFVESLTTDNIRSTAWLTDVDVDMWTQYKNADAVFAIGSPTLELFEASFNATASANGKVEISASIYRMWI